MSTALARLRTVAEAADQDRMARQEAETLRATLRREVVSAVAAGATTSEVVRACGLTRETVRTWANSAGLVPRRGYERAS